MFDTKKENKLAHAVHRMVYFIIRVMKGVGRHELATLVVMLLTVGAIWGFVAIADEVVEGDTHAFDRQIISYTRSPADPTVPIGPEFVQEVGRDITALGGVSVLVIITVAAAGFLLLQRKRGGATLLIVAVVGGLVISTLLKWGFDRDRPEFAEGVFTASFPSGHSAMSAVVFLTLGALLARFQERLALRAYLLGLALVLTMMVGCSRVYLGVHWPSDVLAGWTLGAGWAMVCWLVARWLQRKGTVERESTVQEDEVAAESRSAESNVTQQKDPAAHA